MKKLETIYEEVQESCLKDGCYSIAVTTKLAMEEAIKEYHDDLVEFLEERHEDLFDWRDKESIEASLDLFILKTEADF